MKKALHALLPAGLRAGVLIAVAVFLGGGWVKGAVPASGQVSTRHLYLPFVSNSVPPVSGLALIEKALEAGQIDYPTSLLYRAYTQFDDARLPSAYRGNMVQEDSSLFREYTVASPTLPANIKTLLAPFMVRPDSPSSAWSVFAAANAASTRGANASPQTVSCIPNSNWAAEVSTAPGVKAKVWATCTGTYAADIGTILGYINDLWGPETALMGQPIPDEGGAAGGGGPEIDIYLLNPLDTTPGGRQAFIPGGLLGVTIDAPPYVNATSSAYILVPRDLVYSKDTKDIIAHEFFHVLQMAHDQQILVMNGEEWWFVEASAKWAGAYFVPATSDTDYPFYSGAPENYDYQHSTLSMNATGRAGTDAWAHTYMAFIWPYFIAQERGANAVANIWKALDTHPTFWSDADKLVDNALPLKDNFHRFALRNLNLDLEPGNPINPRFVAQDPKFPDDVQPPNLNMDNENLPATSSTDPGETFSYNLPALMAVYYWFVVPPDVKQVKIYPTNVSSPNRLEVLLKARGGSWSLRDLAGVTSVKLCNVAELYVVASNSELSEPAGGNPRQFAFNIHASDTPCDCSELLNVPSVSGTVTFSYQHSGSSSTHSYQLDQKGSAQFTMPQGSSGPGGVDFWGDATSGTGSIHDVDTIYNSYGPPSVTKVDGDGPAIKPAYLDSPMANLNVNLDKCTFNFDATIYLDMTETDSNGVTTAVQERVGTVFRDDYPLVVTTPATTLSGSGNFPAHSLSWGYLNPGNAYFPGSGVDNYFVSGIMTDGSAGSASVSWSFSAPIPASANGQ
ncbi:MAG: hypothetical protein M1570_04510 [Chloroflexi bacterium]|nr:hypothetical protein [Chloroflexota bacterium]